MSLSDKQKQAVRARAGDCCEYCRLAQSSSFARFHVDHIIALKHGGTDADDNLCLACPDCNAHKGENVPALDPLTRAATKLYHPRQQVWDDHFKIDADAMLSGLTPEGRATDLRAATSMTRTCQTAVGRIHGGDYPCQKD
jgi:hypothetical protein